MLKKICFRIGNNKAFDRFMTICIVVNTLFMTLDHAKPSQVFIDIDKLSNLVFVVIYGIEVLIKLIGFGSKYFYDGWNILDFVIAFFSVGGLVVEFVVQTNLTSINAMIKGIRSIRILKLFKNNYSLKSILNTLVLTIPNLLNVGILLLTLLFIYAVIGINLFAQT